MKKLTVFLLIVIFGVSFLKAAVYEAFEDSMIWDYSDSSRAENYGSLERFSLRSRDTSPITDDSDSHALIKFDLSGISAGVSINGDAVLRLKLKGDPDRVYYHLIAYPGLKAWQESTVTWDSFSSDDPNGPVAGVDYGPVLGQTSIVWNTDFDGDIKEIVIPAATVNGWISDPSSNHGILLMVDLIGDTQASYWTSFWSKDSTEHPGPELIIDYSIPSQCGDLGTEYMAGDLNKDCNVSIADFVVFVENWLECTEPFNPDCSYRGIVNDYIAAPQISQITIDGDLSDWSNSSEWVTFGDWYPTGNPGLLSTSITKYAWNDAENMLYVAIESNESFEMIVEVGGLMGDSSDTTATPDSHDQATQIEFKYDMGTSSLVWANQTGGIVASVNAAYSWDGSKMTFEMSFPIYSDWTNGGVPMDLSSGMDIYAYVNAIASDWSAADSTAADGVYINLYQGRVMELASRINLKP